jgi:uncharacterized membrane protein
MSEVPYRLHPLFVHFPIAFYMTGVVLDLGLWAGLLPAIPGIDGNALAHGLLWAGVIATLPTVAAGLLDYARLPNDIQGNRILQRHILCMGSAFVVFLVAAIWRTKSGAFDAAPAVPIILLEVAGALALIVGGHLAGRAVFEVLPQHLD